MAAIEATGRINEAGKLEVDLPESLPPGTVVHVTIEPTEPDQAWFWTSPGQEAKPHADEHIAEDHNDATTPGGLLEDVDSLDEP